MGLTSSSRQKTSSTLSAVRLNAQMELQNEINLALDAVPQSRRRPDGRYKVCQSEYGNAYVVLRSASNSSQLEQVALYNQHFEHISTFPITGQVERIDLIRFNHSNWGCLSCCLQKIVSVPNPTLYI